eukprot:307965_1
MHMHTTTSPELLDKQREKLENLKLERNYKSTETNHNNNNKMNHTYNGNYYQCEIFLSNKTSIDYTKHVLSNSVIALQNVGSKTISNHRSINLLISINTHRLHGHDVIMHQPIKCTNTNSYELSYTQGL